MGVEFRKSASLTSGLCADISNDGLSLSARPTASIIEALDINGNNSQQIAEYGQTQQQIQRTLSCMYYRIY